MRFISARSIALSILAALCLPGCAASNVHKASQSLVGLSLVEVEGRLGIEAHRVEKPPIVIVQYDYLEPPSSSALPLADLALIPIAWPVALAGTGTVTFGVAKSCHVIITFRNGVAEKPVISGDNGGVSGRGAACEPIFRGIID